MWMQHAVGPAASGADLGLQALRVLLALAGVCVLALFSLRWLASRGVGRPGAGGGRVRVLERVALDAQRAVLLVRADGRTLLLGTGPGAAPTLITELSEPPAIEASPAPESRAPHEAGRD